MKILAETASNHNGDLNYLIKLIDKIIIDENVYITAQILTPESFCDKTYEKYDFIKQIAFNYESWVKVFDHCKKTGHQFIPCPCDISSLEFCLLKGFKLIKIHGSDILNTDIHKVIRKNDIKIILETQFATQRDIDFAINNIGINKIECLIHGFSNYPTEGELVQLNSLDFMKKRWKVKVGFADHTTDTTNIPLMVLSKNATWIEKHITLSRNLRGPDWQPSLEPTEFSIMVNQIRKYRNYLGSFKKHPTATELKMRDVMYKKFVCTNNKLKIVRTNSGDDYWKYKFSSFPQDNVITAVIARLKSTRLKKKVLLPFHNDGMVFDLIRYVEKAKSSKKTILATSFLEADDELVREAKKRNVKCFCGEPLDVTKRLLDLADDEKASAVFRITGDMPFADPMLMDKMNEIRKQYNLDYVRALNLPLGMSAELFSVNFLNKLYLENQNPNESEYLGWFVILDKEAKKGSISVNFNSLKLDAYSLTVDYLEDLQLCKKLLKKINKEQISEITLIDILKNVSLLQEVDVNKEIKLPDNKTMKYYEYLELQKNQGFIVDEMFNVI